MWAPKLFDYLGPFLKETWINGGRKAVPCCPAFFLGLLRIPGCPISRADCKCGPLWRATWSVCQIPAQEAPPETFWFLGLLPSQTNLEATHSGCPSWIEAADQLMGGDYRGGPLGIVASLLYHSSRHRSTAALKYVHTATLTCLLPKGRHDESCIHSSCCDNTSLLSSSLEISPVPRSSSFDERTLVLCYWA